MLNFVAQRLDSKFNIFVTKQIRDSKEIMFRNNCDYISEIKSFVTIKTNTKFSLVQQQKYILLQLTFY